MQNLPGQPARRWAMAQIVLDHNVGIGDMARSAHVVSTLRLERPSVRVMRVLPLRHGGGDVMPLWAQLVALEKELAKISDSLGTLITYHSIRAGCPIRKSLI